MRQAVAKYDMIKKGDLIAVGVSGGKDSLTLLKALAEMRRFADFSYDIIALTVDNGTVSESDLNTISKFSASLNVKHEIIRTDIAKIVFDMRRESNPCSLCAHMRRGALIDRAVELNCTAVALGHHMNDVAETYIMNIFLAGRAGCFFPVTVYPESGMRLIRPFIYVREHSISGFAKKSALPVLSKTCPVDGITEREHIKELLKSEDARHRGVYDRIIGALERSGVDLWHE